MNKQTNKQTNQPINHQSKQASKHTTYQPTNEQSSFFSCECVRITHKELLKLGQINKSECSIHTES